MNFILGFTIIILSIVLLILVLYNDTHNKLKNLYTEDFHGTSRPKVDIVEEDRMDDNTRIWDRVTKLESRIDDNEKARIKIIIASQVKTASMKNISSFNLLAICFFLTHPLVPSLILERG